MDINIQEMKDKDWPKIESIYLEGISTGNATFETESPGWDVWNEIYLDTCRLVAETGNQIAGWVAISPVSNRSAYSGVSEVSLYVTESARNRGVGKCLLEALIIKSEREKIWTLQAGIFPENGSSISLFKKLGFREIGLRERIGQLNGAWRDVLLLERRSPVIK